MSECWELIRDVKHGDDIFKGQYQGVSYRVMKFGYIWVSIELSMLSNSIPFNFISDMGLRGRAVVEAFPGSVWTLEYAYDLQSDATPRHYTNKGMVKRGFTREAEWSLSEILTHVVECIDRLLLLSRFITEVETRHASRPLSLSKKLNPEKAIRRVNI